MAVREPIAYKELVGNTPLSLTAQAGQAFLITGVYVRTPVSALATLRVDKTTVGAFRVSGTQGNHLFFPDYSVHVGNLLDFLFASGRFAGYPVPEGSTFLMTGVAQATSLVVIKYRILDPGDVKPDQINGPSARQYQYMCYGQYSTTLVAGDNRYATQISPVELPGFPWTENAPAGKKTRLHAICFTDVGKTSGTAANKHITNYLKLIREREILWDVDRNGLLTYGAAPAGDGTQVGYGAGMVGNRSSADTSGPLLLDSPMEFAGGDELDVYVTTSLVAGVANLAAADAEVGLWLEAVG